MKGHGLMNSIDGFNERNFYVRKSTDINRLKSKGPSKFDNSLAKMNSERRGLVQTTDSSEPLKPIEDVRGSRENFIIQNNHISNFGKKVPDNNYVSRALNNNKFKKIS